VKVNPRLKTEPWAFDFFDTLRRLERENPDKPRIGNSGAVREEFVHLGQDTWMDFPASTLAQAREMPDGRLYILQKFLGLLGPQGALPYAITDEAFGWVQAGDESFPRFLDVLHHRFLQLFFRAWADARPAAQRDRPAQDRFRAYAGSPIGIGSRPYHDLDSVPDHAKLAFAGLLGPRTRSPEQLRHFLEGLFGTRIVVEPFRGSWLTFELNDGSRLGQRHATLGHDALMGASVFSLEDKFRIQIFVPDLSIYRRFLPGGEWSVKLRDAVFFVVGHELGWDIELAIPEDKIEPMRLGRAGQLGWTGWLSPPGREGEPAMRTDARFDGQHKGPRSARTTTKTKSGKGGRT
jgi:type VI secretion system protein ImpH